VQVDPIQPVLKAPGAKRLKLECDILLSNSTFKFNLRRHIKDAANAVLNIVYGVNHKDYDAASDHIVTAASCTTHCLAPVVSVVQKNLVGRCRLTLLNPYFESAWSEALETKI